MLFNKFIYRSVSPGILSVIMPVIFEIFIYRHHHHHVPEGLGVFPIP